MNRFSAFAAVAIMTGVFSAQAQESADYILAEQKYRACVETASSAPEQALADALTWRDTGGGLPARHCAALAMAWLGLYAEAAAEFEALAGDMQRGAGWVFDDKPHPKETGLLAEV